MTRLQRAPGIALIADEDTVYTARLPDGPIVVLNGVAALIWHEACRGDRESIADRVARATDAPPDAIRADVDAFVTDLVSRGLLE